MVYEEERRRIYQVQNCFMKGMPVKIKSSLNIAPEKLQGYSGVTVRWLWSETDQAPNFALRLFELEPGASTPHHQHSHEHEVFILRGTCTLRGEADEHQLRAGDTVLVEPDEAHQFTNTGDEPLQFLCAIPHLTQDLLTVSAQVSLYPLRQTELKPAIDKALASFRQHGLAVSAGPMSTIISGPWRQVFQALQSAFVGSAETGDVVMQVALSNACPVERSSRPSTASMQARAIGYVRNEFDTPVAPDEIKQATSDIVIDPELTLGLDGLHAGEHILVIFAFHLSEGFLLKQHPRGDRSRPERGVFALRSPNRPNPIGVTKVELLAVQDNLLTVRGLDAINRSPVLDIKPA
ncbi:MAG: tRNA (N6-threonylcarbamoyladenosine(37)-N6)-methyltransferase TrmO [Anaerolineales bacterium]